VLPIRQPGAADPPPPAHFAVPEAAPPPDHVMLGGAEEERTWWRDAKRGITRVTSQSAHFPHLLLKASGIKYDERAQDTYEITDGSPLSALATSERQISIARGAWQTRVETRSTLSATREHFLLTNAIDAYEGQDRVFAKNWSRAIARDGC
jgi:hypothetical protein